MSEYISRDVAIQAICNQCEANGNCGHTCAIVCAIESIPAADVRPVVVCANCEHNNHCLTQEFVDDCGKIPLDRSTFFCADGERRNNA